MRTAPISVRLAVDSEVSQIRDMVQKGYDIEMTWDAVFPHWLVAEDESGIMACVMILVGKPFGAIEFLCFRPRLSAAKKVMAVRKMAVAALAILQAAGCGAAFGMVPQGLQSWRNVLKRQWKATVGRECNVFWKGLR